jgi:hypothetical protein
VAMKASLRALHAMPRAYAGISPPDLTLTFSRVGHNYVKKAGKDGSMGSAKYSIVVVLVALCLASGAPGSAQLLEDSTPDESLDGAFFYIRFRPDYVRAAWVFEGETDRIIGYATWDALRRRWTLFTLKNRYSGFLQATLGTTSPPHYRQYLWYDKENRYKGLFVSRLGGRPISPDLPFGELGGERDLYARGNIPMRPPEYEIEVDPLKRFPYGVDISPIERPVRSFK